MTAFEYLSVALSFVLGLGVTHLLVSAARLFKRCEDISTDWITILWAVTVFVHQIHFWWTMFGLSDLPSWSLGAFLNLLMMVLLLFVAGALVLPETAREGPIDLRVHCAQNGRWALIALFAFLAFGTTFDYFLFGVPWVSQMNLIRLVPLSLLAVGALDARRRVGGFVAVAYLTVVLAWIGVFAPMEF